jgi:hypothetical protein
MLPRFAGGFAAGFATAAMAVVSYPPGRRSFALRRSRCNRAM